MYSIHVFSPFHISTGLFLGKGGGSNILSEEQLGKDTHKK